MDGSVRGVWWVCGWIWCSGWWMGGLVEVDVFGCVWVDWWAIGGGWVGRYESVDRWMKIRYFEIIYESFSVAIKSMS